MKNVPGRKSDVIDCAWLGQLLECGLLRGSFIPLPQIAAIRELTRYRKKLIESRTLELQRLSKVLEDGGAMWPSFPTSDYYDGSAPSCDYQQTTCLPATGLAAQFDGRPQNGFPRSPRMRSTGWVPSYAPAAIGQYAADFPARHRSASRTQVRDPQAVLRGGGEVPFHEVRPDVRAGPGQRCPRAFPTGDAPQARGFHQRYTVQRATGRPPTPPSRPSCA